MKRGDKVYYMGIECRVCNNTETDDTMVKIAKASEFNLPHFEEMYADYVPINAIKFGN